VAVDAGPFRDAEPPAEVDEPEDSPLAGEDGAPALALELPVPVAGPPSAAGFEFEDADEDDEDESPEFESVDPAGSEPAVELVPDCDPVVAEDPPPTAVEPLTAASTTPLTVSSGAPSPVADPVGAPGSRIRSCPVMKPPPGCRRVAGSVAPARSMLRALPPTTVE
jgi:hypothetical protein